MRSAVVGLAVMLTIVSAYAYTELPPPPVAQAVSSAPAQAANELLIPEGTEVVATASETISSKTAAEGDPVNLRVEEDVLVNGVVVIAHGSLIKGSVSGATRAGHMGKAGRLNVRVESTVAIDGTRVRLRAAKAKTGDDKVGATVALTVLFGPLGLLKKGREAILREGSHIPVFVDYPVKIHAQDRGAHPAGEESPRVASAKPVDATAGGVSAPISAETSRVTSTSSRIRVITEPPGAYIYVGDVRVAETVPEGAVIDLPKGTHSMRIRKAGYAPVNRELVVAPSAEGTPDLTLQFELSTAQQPPRLVAAAVPAPVQQVGTSQDPIRVSKSLIRLMVIPAGAEITVGSTHIGTSSEAGVLFALPSGRSRCMVTKRGYVPLSRVFLLEREPNERGEQRVEMRLELDRDPSGRNAP